jgi:hypothetical protein
MSLRGRVREYGLPKSLIPQRREERDRRLAMSKKQLQQEQQKQAAAQRGGLAGQGDKKKNRASGLPSSASFPPPPFPATFAPLSRHGSASNSPLFGSQANMTNMNSESMLKLSQQLNQMSATGLAPFPLPGATSMSFTAPRQSTYVEPTGPLDRTAVLTGLPEHLVVHTHTAVKARETGVSLRSKQSEQPLAQLTGRVTKQLEQDLTGLNFDKTKPVPHASRAAMLVFDELRCDLVTAMNLRKNLEQLTKDRDDARGRTQHAITAARKPQQKKEPSAVPHLSVSVPPIAMPFAAPASSAHRATGAAGGSGATSKILDDGTGGFPLEKKRSLDVSASMGGVGMGGPGEREKKRPKK